MCQDCSLQDRKSQRLLSSLPQLYPRSPVRRNIQEASFLLCLQAGYSPPQFWAGDAFAPAPLPSPL